MEGNFSSKVWQSYVTLRTPQFGLKISATYGNRNFVKKKNHLATDNHKVYCLLECATPYCGRNSPPPKVKLLPPMNFTNFSG
jgi:hypothetical protein